MDVDSPIQKIRSPSHPISVTLGKLSTATSDFHRTSQASAALSLGTTVLEKDFILEILHKDCGNPRALLEVQPRSTGYRALMTTLVPRTSPQSSKPEIIFVADQSGSMGGEKTRTLVAALKTFLKSLPVGITFNICFFGSRYTLLFEESQEYNEDSLTKAIDSLNDLNARYGGTETLQAIRASIESRDSNKDLSLILATDGNIWQQQDLFDYLNTSVAQSKKALRVFALGIGDAVSSALIEGVAKAGNGFAQSVVNGEKLDSKVIRMLKGALTPDSGNYTLEVRYEKDEEDFVFVERVQDSLRVMTIDDDADLLDEGRAATKDSKANDVDGQARYNNLPVIEAPKLLQTPQRIPPLYPFSRTTVYILMSPEASQAIPKSVILRNDSVDDPFEMEIPVEVLAEPSETIHQLAAKRTISELEEGRGWLNHAQTGSGTLIKEKHHNQFTSLVEREAVRLGVQYQIAGKYTSFVAVEGTTTDDSVDQDTSIQIDIVKGSPAPAPARTSRGYASYSSPSSAKATARFCSFGSTRGSDITSRYPSNHLALPEDPRRSSLGRSAATTTSFRAPASRGRGGRRSAQSFEATGCKMGGGDPDTNSDVEFATGFGMFDESTSDRSAASSPTPRWDPLQDLIALQTFEGFWELNPELTRVDSDFSDGEKQIPDGLSSKVWATMLAIEYLEHNEAGKKEVWELVAEKARGWLIKQGVTDENPGWEVAGLVFGGMGF